ncbi:MFS transporter [Deinococcus maricopensis]|uniref:Major facilitator superfamily MFS_1 n=1 Tax=Deinococcus maricopensis (strain DSM 21211 / LMG 22137 / NRRL B-23946 / LB-34) TaxID=709986 RepID=E8U493_DEIML|nr:MFS transporter [Deinococcus maricopensis]ADV65930.1 major facilitator superfamily MFS_1 [Deinococcus maricopensis DSM 21211]
MTLSATSAQAPAPDLTTRVTILLLAALTIMSGATIAPALPAMQAHFAGTPDAALLVKLSLTILGLVIAITAPISGVLVDRFGRRPVLLGALLLYAVGGASGLFAPTLATILVGRVVLGLAVGATMTATGALVNDLFHGADRGRFLSQQAAFTSFGGAVLLPLGGALAAVSWRAPFGIYLISLLLIPLVLRLPRGVPAGHAHGQAAGAPRWPVIAVIYGLALAYMAAFYLMPTQGPFVLSGLGAAPSMAGLLLGTFTLVGAVTSLTYSRFVGRFDPRRAAALGMALLGGGWVVVSQAPTLPAALVGLVLAGLGGGLVFPNLYTWLADFTPPAWRGRITAGMSSAVFLGQFLSPLVFAAPAGHEARGFLWGAVFAVVLAVVLALSTFAGRARR